MENSQSLEIFSCFLLLLFHFSFHSWACTLPEQYFINCGSASSPTVYGRRTFTGDVKSEKIVLSSGGNSPVEDPGSSAAELYRSARIFRKLSSYELDIAENGTYVVRFHFFPFPALGNLSDARFNVEASEFRVLSNFSIQSGSSFPLIEEILLTIPPGKFKIKFVPSEENSFAFVNAMEVFPGPPEFIPDSAVLATRGVDNYNGLLSSPLRVIHRINVGGPNIMPNNDTLLRYWIPDDYYLFNKNTAKNSGTYGGTINYQSPGATDCDAPPSVYNTAKEMNIVDNSSQLPMFNISWCFDVKKGAKHLVRVHFCDIITRARNEFLTFDLFIDSQFNQKIYPYGAVSRPAAPFYYDFVVDSDNSGFLNISVGPRSDSRNPTAFLNGVEIMELITGLASSTGGSDSPKQHLLIIIGSVVGGVILVLVLLIVVFCGLKKRKWKPVEAFDWPLAHLYGGSTYSRTTERTVTSSPAADFNLGLKVPFTEILYATKNFNKKLRIGEGGFGKVYKGTMRNGTKVAVKRSEPGHGQGLPEFQTEIMVLSKIRHHHLVSLIGYCDERDEMILVYEFMEKGTLRDHLYVLAGESRESTSRSTLSWDQRLGICIGAAKGIHYLHTGSSGAIIHRDIKSTNILLDEDYVAKVADFGLSRSGPPDQTHVSTAVKGSFGYLDPEYFRCLQLTQKSDVYSFGVVLLEVLCARPAIDNSLPREQINLAEWGLSWHRKGQLEKIVDPLLVGKINPSSLRKFGETVEKCLQEYGADRPNMSDVMWDLEYSLQLQRTAVPREPYEDSTTDVSWNFQMNILQKLPSQSIQIGEDELQHDSTHNFSDVSQVNASEVFSQLSIDEAR
ncbi:probable receptor-like protein kinase At5g24010 [Sesamum indicum]|uniref:Probable receptor-like protein kinase At5g24010 n=1 Tax=Sesamum indicum TaxID=4182 RepID=A0A6I9UJW9_SESIN|nr:probable receptor-like protein kinase At5g24010 [Sesamum indicum]